MPEPGMGNAPERDGFGGREGGGGGGRAGGVGTPGVGGGFAPRDFNRGFGRDRDVADRFRQTFGGGFMTERPGMGFQQPGASREDILKSLLFGPLGPLGFGLGRMGQHLFTPGPTGVRGFTPPGGSAAAAEARAGERGDRDGRLQMAPILEQLFGGGFARRGQEQFAVNPTEGKAERVAEIMNQLQELLSPGA